MSFSDTIKTKLKWLYFFTADNAIFIITTNLPILLSSLTSSSLFANSLYHATTIKQKLAIVSFTSINFLNYFLLITILLALCLIGLIFISAKYHRATAIIFFSSAIFILIIDQIIFRIYKLHLNTTLLTMMLTPSVFSLSFIESAILLSLFMCIFAVELYLAKRAKRLVEKHHKALAPALCTISICGFMLLVCFFTLARSMANGITLLAQQTTNLPHFEYIYIKLTNSFGLKHDLHDYTQQAEYQNISHPINLNYPLKPTHCKPKAKYNLMIITVDSLRYDMLNKINMPKTLQFKNEFSTFTNHWSGGNATRPGLFSLFYSIPPNYMTSIENKNIAPFLTQQLAKSNYMQYVIWSASMAGYRNNFFLKHKKWVITAKKTPSNDLENLNKIKEILARHKQPSTANPFYINTLLYSPHAFCAIEGLTEPFTPTSKQCIRGYNNKNMMRRYFNKYKNAVYHVDKIISELIETLKNNKQWQNTIVIITSDHGEEFNDNKLGYFGHTSNYTKYQLQVPLWIHWPQKSTEVYTHKTTHYDIAPTILEESFTCSNNSTTYSIGKNLYKEKPTKSFIAGSYVNSAIITDKELLVLTNSGNFKSYDLNYKRRAKHTIATEVLLEKFKQMKKWHAYK